ncbi:YcaO-like family protein [Nonomuraea sp. K274]|uniref:YcaO-like family protein n=1 Tax=Nonomuraea cypriaca TaxID=1187855 RepID=A0A931ADU2_9ACTN|nr:YcaO-like family protein [Nonomuraea cypriaca]MBF8191026.1 YcaO-like family protein [Nonomuraea cypriaca]
MKLLLRQDAYYTEAPEGVYLVTHKGPAMLGGGSVHGLLLRLVPYLDGRYTLDELTEGLAEERRGPVTRLIRALMARGAIQRVDRPEEVPGRDEESFLGYFLSSGRDSFARYQATRTEVGGDGALLAEVVAAARRSGLRHVGVSGDLDPAEADLVLYVSEHPREETTRRVAELCAATGTPLAQAFILDGELWYGMLDWTTLTRRLTARPHSSPRPGAGLADPGTGRAIGARQFVHQVFRTVTAVSTPRPGRVTRFDVATLARQEHAVLRHPFALDVAPAGEEAFLATLASRREAPPLDGETLSQRAAPCADDRLGVFGPPDEGDFIQLPLNVCQIAVSDPVGLLGTSPQVIGTGLDFATARYTAALRAFAVYGSLMVDPRLLLNADGSPFTDNADAGLTALRDAVSRHQATAERSLSGVETGAVHAALRNGGGHQVADGRALSGTETGGVHVALREGGAEGGGVHVRGYSLAGGGVRLVPVGVAFPLLSRIPVAGPYRVPEGVASGYSWDEAVLAGVLAQVRRLTLEELSGPVRRLDQSQVTMDATGERYRSMLTAMREEVVAGDLTGSLGVPTVVCRAGRSEGVASGLTYAEALRDAMRDTLLGLQSRMHAQPAYAPSDLAEMQLTAPPDLAEMQPIASLDLAEMQLTAPPDLAEMPLKDAAPVEPSWRRVAEVAEIAAALAARGADLVVVPLDHDPEVSLAMPNTVHVVLLHD